MSKKYSILFSAAIMSLTLFSCGSKGNGEGGGGLDREETKDTIKKDVQIDLQVMKSKVPSPADLGKKFSAAGLSYNKSALLSSGKASSYSNRYSQSLGVGAYGADLGFACAYNQSQDALEYLNAIGKLAQDLGVASAF